VEKLTLVFLKGIIFNNKKNKTLLIIFVEWVNKRQTAVNGFSHNLLFLQGPNCMCENIKKRERERISTLL
jgi:hypothetical protein